MPLSDPTAAILRSACVAIVLRPFYLLPSKKPLCLLISACRENEMTAWPEIVLHQTMIDMEFRRKS